MRSFLVISALLTSTHSFAAIDMYCAESSFLPTTIHAVETARGLELTVEDLGGGENYALAVNSATSIATGSAPNVLLHAIITDKTSGQGDEGVWESKSRPGASPAGKPWDDTKMKNIWLEQTLPGLGQWEKHLVPISVENMKAIVTDDQITLTFKQLWAVPGQENVTISAPCKGGLPRPIGGIPERLTNFLDSQKH
jgi:hypothetical protein